MKSFRTPRYLERFEDVVFDLENRLEKLSLMILNIKIEMV